MIQANLTFIIIAVRSSWNLKQNLERAMPEKIGFVFCVLQLIQMTQLNDIGFETAMQLLWHFL